MREVYQHKKSDTRLHQPLLNYLTRFTQCQVAFLPITWHRGLVCMFHELQYVEQELYSALTLLFLRDL
jgi:hypothetical protein